MDTGLQTGVFNTGVGIYAGSSLKTGSYNVFMGANAGLFGAPSNSVFIGSDAGHSTGSDYNVFIGNETGYNTSLDPGTANSTKKGYSNIFVGYRAGYQNNIGSNNVMIGDSAGYRNAVSGNIFLGSKAGYSNQNGNQNTFVGFQTGYNNTNSANTFFGYQAGYTNTSGQANVFIGSQSGYNNSSGTGNLFLGQQAGSNNTTGNYNLFMGNGSGSATTSGTGNTAIGDGSSLHNTTGQRNVSIGQYSGLNNATGTDNVFIGYGAKAGTVNPTNVTNSVALGANAIVSASNSIILGGSGVNVGIGNSAPSAKLEVSSGVANTTGLKFTNLNYSFVPSTNASKFLTVDASGTVILATYAAGARIGAVTDAFWQRNGQFLQPLTNEPVVIGSTISQTPAGYKLFVEEGILTERVKVAVKNTSEWSDKVFAKTYQLQPLADVARYIEQHQHLPGVPSAAEMVAKGNDLHQTDAKLLEKIEELTLYSIQLEKANRTQAEKLQAMEQEQQRQKQKQAELERLLQGVLKRK